MRFFENPSLSRATYAAFRIVTGLLFMQHGAQKLFGAFGGVDGKGMTPPLMSMFGAAGVLEFFGGLLIVLGLFTSPVAFLLAGQMAVAYWTMHVPNGGMIPIINQGELAALYCFNFLFLAFHGAGPLSIDESRTRRTVTTTQGR